VAALTFAAGFALIRVRRFLRGPRAGDGRKRRARWILVLATATVLAAAVLVPPVVAWSSTAGVTYAAPQDVPEAPVAIVLGAGIDPSGRPSRFLGQRIAVAVQLYRQGKVRALLMSGDNSRTDYDEVGVMAAEAVRQGVPAAAVVQDHAGFDTYSSCYRARSVWGLDQVVVVSQPFHLPRAVWLCRSLGLRTVGAATEPGPFGPTWYGRLREIPAIDKAMLDVLRNRTPRFPGPREPTLDNILAN
jgi:vancomycin permeability regulator SanA